jgi:hypothetical protein
MLTMYVLGNQMIPNVTTFPNNVATIVKYAQASYCETIYKLKKYDCMYNCAGTANGTVLQSAIHDKFTTGGVLISYNQNLKSIFVSFKGTDTWQNWILDAILWKTTVAWTLPGSSWKANDEIKVHAGFAMLYNHLRNMVLDVTLELAEKWPNHEIVFTGHSLGGALATLAAVDFQDHYGYGNRISLYTFGAPRIGNQNLAKFLNSLPFASRIYRIQQRGDPFVQLPPLFSGYRHSLQQYQIRDDGSMIKCHNTGETGEAQGCLDSFLKLNIKSHFGYFERMDPC